MASQPLLGSSTNNSFDLKMSWVCMIRQWWSVSTSESWLTSAISRRDLHMPLLVMVCLAFTIYDQLYVLDLDLAGKLGTLAIDLAADALTISSSFCLHQDSLRRDVVYSIAYGVVLVLSALQVRLFSENGLDPQSGVEELTLLIFVFTCGGTHSLCVLAMCLETVFFLIVIRAEAQLQLFLCFGTLIWASAFCLEYRGGQALANIKWAEEVLTHSRARAINDTLVVGGGTLHSCTDLEVIVEKSSHSAFADGSITAGCSQGAALLSSVLASSVEDSEFSLSLSNSTEGTCMIIQRKYVETSAQTELSLHSTSATADGECGNHVATENNCSDSISAQAVDCKLPINVCSVTVQTQSTQALPPISCQDRAQRALARHRARHPQVKLNTCKLTLSAFEETPKRTVIYLLIDALMRINARGKGCCFFHVGLHVLRRQIVDLIKEKCNPQFTLKADEKWQCASCLVLNDLEDSDEADGEDRSCPLCGAAHVTAENAALHLEEDTLSCAADVSSYDDAV